MCVLPSTLIANQELGGEPNVKTSNIPSNRTNDFNNIKFSLAMYSIHTMGK